MKKRVAVFSGSFNPIHIGHLALANYVCETNQVDELWFMVTPENPLKSAQILAQDQLRLKMVKIAITGYDKFKLCDLEFSLPRPSYTINTLRELQKSYPEYKFSLLIGADNWNSFHKWKSSEIILRDFDLLIYPRMNHEVNISTLPLNVQLIDSPIIEISATQIREKIKQGKDFRYFLYPSVFEFITKHKLYQ